MKNVFSQNAWEDYTSWFNQDKSMLKKINELIKEIHHTPFSWKGKLEPLKYDLKGMWSRRIDLEHRLVYKIEDDSILIYSCKYHYD